MRSSSPSRSPHRPRLLPINATTDQSFSSHPLSITFVHSRARRLAAYIQSAPDRAAAQAQQAQTKLDALNAEIARLDGATSQKRRLDDHEFVEESKEIVEGVRDAVKEGELRERGSARSWGE